MARLNSWKLQTSKDCQYHRLTLARDIRKENMARIPAAQAEKKKPLFDGV